MSRRAKLILICEDTAQEVFVRRFLALAGWETRAMRVEKAPPGRGAGEQFVREKLPNELVAYRSRRNQISLAVILVTDGDREGHAARMRQLDAYCSEKRITPRMPGEGVAYIIPTWNIEAWFAYLNGEDVDETRKDYPRLDRPRNCHPLAAVLHTMCARGSLRQPAPPSLATACVEYRDRLARTEH